ncbi:DUF983 domain-containing protein [Croceitalea sp. MTPC5]|uniref:DUF983 domain-containing protein n=1 Tax=Croceitalea sp. MTPC5 TaxID=3056565 RepID=UPI002B3D3FF8|nr:DUF983 domain-containing protein [Croceitalea sp. MTPC5]
MLKKGSKLYSILTGSCPKCHAESMYKNQNPYALGTLFKMHERCSNCHTKYKIEPSFFYGSMYVSYGVGVAFAVATFVLAFLIFKTSLMNTFVAIVLTLIVFMPIIIRLSRNIWINLFIKYDPNLKDQPK